MKPILQLFALPQVLENIPEFRSRKRKFYIGLETIRQNTDDEKYRAKAGQFRNNEVKILIFDEFLRNVDNKKKGHQNINLFFRKSV